jgi:hypothetical protein
MDVKTTFLNGEPDGFVVCSKESQLKKALYGFKQAPRVWYDRIDGLLQSLGLTSILELLKINLLF